VKPTDGKHRSYVGDMIMMLYPPFANDMPHVKVFTNLKYPKYASSAKYYAADEIIAETKNQVGHSTFFAPVML
jgi:hypothetical protein